MSTEDRVMAILRDAKQLALEYRQVTGKPLGVTGEVAEFEAARFLSIQLSGARQEGYDAVENAYGGVRRLQIKGRCVLKDSKSSQQLGSIRVDTEWDAVLMVLLDENLDAFEIYEADRNSVIEVLSVAGSKARERGAMSVKKFKSIGRLRWQRESSDA